MTDFRDRSSQRGRRHETRTLDPGNRSNYDRAGAENEYLSEEEIFSDMRKDSRVRPSSDQETRNNFQKYSVPLPGMHRGRGGRGTDQGHENVSYRNTEDWDERFDKRRSEPYSEYILFIRHVFVVMPA